MKAKTLVIVTFKNGSEKRVNSAEEPLKLIQSMTVGGGWGVCDIDGSWLIINSEDYLFIELIPQIPQE